MPGSKYDREIRFIATETSRLTSIVNGLMQQIPADPEEARRNADTIEEIEAKIAQYQARRKEIEDSFISVGLEVPIASRNLNATVYRVGSNFEPEDKEYRDKVASGILGNIEADVVDINVVPKESIAPATSIRTAEEAPAAPAAPAPAPKDETPLDIPTLNAMISELEIQLVDAQIGDDQRLVIELEDRMSDLRAKRDAEIMRIKEEKARKAAAAAAPASDAALLEKIESLEKECRSLKSQLSAVRGDCLEANAKIRAIMDFLHMDEDREEY